MSDAIFSALTSIEPYTPGPEFDALLADLEQDCKHRGRSVALCLVYDKPNQDDFWRTMDWWQSARCASIMELGFSESAASTISSACVTAILEDALAVCLNLHLDGGRA